MEGHPKESRLKDGTPVTLQRMVESDLEGLYAFFCSLPEEDRLYMKDDVTDRKVIEKWVGNIDHDHILVVLATIDGTIVGNATLHVDKIGWTRHRGEIRCVVAREHQRRGIGTLLAHELLQSAITRGLKRIMVQVLENQIGAIKAFGNLGFEASATLPGHAVDLNGDRHDILIIANETEEIWQKLEELILDMDLGVKR